MAFDAKNCEALTEEEIIEGICRGGRARDRAIKRLYDESASAMLRFFVYRGVSSDEAKDILQDCIVSIVRGAEGFSGKGSGRAWMWQIARNCMTDHLRKSSRLTAHETVLDERKWQRLENVTAGPESTSAVKRTAIEKCVDDALGAFARDNSDRAYVLTLQMENISVKEISQRIGRTVAATKEYLSQCKKKLRPYVAHCMDLLVD